MLRRMRPSVLHKAAISLMSALSLPLLPLLLGISPTWNLNLQHVTAIRVHNLAQNASLSTVYPHAKAQFGAQTFNLTASLALASPPRLCQAMSPHFNVTGKIVLIERGDCFYVDKALRAVQAGAVAVIIGNNAGTTEIPFMKSGNRASELYVRRTPCVAISRDAYLALSLPLAMGHPGPITHLNNAQRDGDISVSIGQPTDIDQPKTIVYLIVPILWLSLICAFYTRRGISEVQESILRRHRANRARLLPIVAFAPAMVHQQNNNDQQHNTNDCTATATTTAASNNYEVGVAVLDDDLESGSRSNSMNSPAVAIARWQSTEGRHIYDDTCAICFEEYECGTPVKVLPCDHGFHPECIDPWINVHGTCPLQCPVTVSALSILDENAQYQWYYRFFLPRSQRPEGVRRRWQQEDPHMRQHGRGGDGNEAPDEAVLLSETVSLSDM